jgi:hypothetical protein
VKEEEEDEDEDLTVILRTCALCTGQRDLADLIDGSKVFERLRF